MFRFVFWLSQLTRSMPFVYVINAPISRWLSRSRHVTLRRGATCHAPGPRTRVNTNPIDSPHLHIAIPFSIAIFTTSTPIHTSVHLHTHVILVNRPPLSRYICLPGALPQYTILTTRPSTSRVGFASTCFRFVRFRGDAPARHGQCEDGGISGPRFGVVMLLRRSQGCSLRPTQSKPGWVGLLRAKVIH
jgi:hypothetical protein